MEHEHYPDYWWYETGRHLFRGLQRERYGSAEWKLDPVKVAGRLKVPILAEMARDIKESRSERHVKAQWIDDLLKILEAKSLEDFCGGILDEPKLSMEEMRSLENMQVPRERAAMLEQLREWGLVERLPEGMRVTGSIHFYTGLFAVPKSSGLWRIIFDCREVNAWMRSPFAFELPLISEIFSTVWAFEHFAVFDLRQFFYMLPLPDVARNLFLLSCGDKCYRAAVWCMGYHTSPWTAQSVSTLVTVIAVYKAGLYIKDVGQDRRAPPRLLEIIDKDGVVVGRILWWIDNCLIATTSVATRERILQFLMGHNHEPEECGVLIRTSLAVKGSWHDPDTSEIPSYSNRHKGVTLSSGSVTFLNINFRREHDSKCTLKQNNFDRKKIWWKHTDVTKWEKIRVIPRRGAYKIWVHLVGVLMWHWQLGGEDKGSISTVVELSRKLGHMGPEDFIEIDDVTQRDLQRAVDDLFQDEEHLRVLESLPKRCVIAASDASKSAGAGVAWARNEQGREYICYGPEHWKGAISGKDINVRETWASLKTASALLDQGVSDKLILLGTDNVSARAAVRHGFYPGEGELTDALQDMKKRAGRAMCMIKIVHIAGRIMAADAPSRMQALDEVLCEKTRTELLAHWKELCRDEQIKKIRTKRERQ